MKYGIWAMRSAASVCGASQAWLKSDGEPITFDTYEEAAAKAKEMNDNAYSANVSYRAEEMDIEETESPSFGMNM